jgi:cobalamin 5'-phosphate synthase/cobalamin synthase
MKLLKGFALAFSMLSIIPFFKVHDFFKGINGYSAMSYPLVGFILGIILWKTSVVLSPFVPPVHLSVILFVLWVTLTGALHLDGLSDTIDGLFVNKERALEVMKDSHIGGMGMIFTLVFLLFKLSSIIYFDAYYLLPIILMLSRLNATLGIYFTEYVGGGMGLLAKQELKFWQVALGFLFAFGLVLYVGDIYLLALALLTLAVCAKFFSARLGGMSGDIYGFCIELTELVLLNYLLVLHFA